MSTTAAVVAFVVAFVVAVVVVVVVVAVVDKQVGNNSCFTMVMTNWFWAQRQFRNCHMDFD